MKRLLIPLLCLLSAAAYGQVGPIVMTATTSPCAQIGIGAKGSQVAIVVSGTFSATLQPELSVQGQAAANTQVTPSTSSTAQSTITAAGTYFTVNVAGADTFLLCPTGFVSGTVTVYLNISTAGSVSKGGSSGGGSSAGTQYSAQTSDGAGGFVAVTPPSTNCTWLLSSAVTASAAVAPTWNCPGVPVDATNPATLLVTDRANFLNWTSGSALALPAVAGTFANNFTFVIRNTSGGTLTITPNAGASDLIDGSSSGTLPTNYAAFVYQDSTSAPGHWFTIKAPLVAAISIANGKTLTVSNTMTLAGTDSSTYTFPGASATMTQTIGSGTITVTGDAPTSGACASEHTASIAALLTTDVVKVSFNSDPSGVTGIAPSASGGVYVLAYPKAAGTLGLKVCNDTANTITVGTLVLNYQVTR